MILTNCHVSHGPMIYDHVIATFIEKTQLYAHILCNSSTLKRNKQEPPLLIWIIFNPCMDK